MQQIVRHQIPVLVARRAVQIPDLVAVPDRERACNRRPLGVKRHIEPRVLAKVVEHRGEIFGLSRDEAVTHAGRQHEFGERGHHFLPADLHGHALARSEADVVAPLLVEPRHDLVLGLPLDVQAEDVARLDGLEVFAALLAPEAEAAEHLGKGRVGRGHVRVDLDDVSLFLLRESLRALQQLGKRLPVVQIADRRAAAVHQRPPNAGHLPRHQRHRPFDFAIFTAHGDGVPVPHGLLLAPEPALGKVALRMRLDKRLIFRDLFLRDDLVHIVHL